MAMGRFTTKARIAPPLLLLVQLLLGPAPPALSAGKR